MDNRAVGIDISHYQKSFIFQGNIDFVIVKITEGEYWDPWIVANWKEIDKVPVKGAYHYFRTGMDPIKQAQLFVDMARGCEFDFLAVDYEETNNVLDQEGERNLTSFWNRVIQSTDLPLVLYTRESILVQLIKYNAHWSRVPFWVARWNSAIEDPLKDKTLSWVLWQYSSKGNKEGGNYGVESEDVDLNRDNGKFIRRFIMKAWYQSKTIWVGIIEVVIGILGLFADFLDVGDFTSPAIVFLVIGFLKIGLRYLTDQGIE